MINKELMEILACPACKANVKEESDKIACISCGKKYPIKEGIPVMLVEEVENN